MPTVDPIRDACRKLDKSFFEWQPKPTSRKEKREIDAYYRELSKQRSGKVSW